MRNRALIAVAAISAALLAETGMAGTVAAETAMPIAAMRWQRRPLLIFAPRGDTRLARQHELIAGGEAAARDLATVTIVGDAVSGATDRAAALRRRFKIDPAGFTVILVGKDGGEKLRSREPLSADRLFATIDAMPMRRDEMHR